MNTSVDVKALEVEKSSIICGDALRILDQLPENFFTLAISSPPYNIGKSYERNKMTIDEYIEWIEPIITKMCNKITLDGSVCWQSGNYVNDGSVIPLDYIFFGIFSKLGFKLRNRIIWKFNFGLHANKRFSGRYETLLWLTRSDEYKFNLDPVRVPQLYPGKRHSSKKGDKAGKPSGNPLGKNPSDVWEFDADEAFFKEPVWSIPNVKAGHPEKTQHPCQFPNELAERCVLALTNKDDYILDPFVGAGTSVIAAARNGRHGIGIDKDEMFVNAARERICNLFQGTLKLRVSGSTAATPRKTQKVASIPAEWISEG